MASFNPKVFIRPDGLKRIANVHLIELLEPWRDYFAKRGFVFPTDPADEFPHNDLAKTGRIRVPRPGQRQPSFLYDSRDGHTGKSGGEYKNFVLIIIVDLSDLFRKKY